ncbi:hypothetical protein LTR66_015713, partial [Elasticomyces elasticus]
MHSFVESEYITSSVFKKLTANRIRKVSNAFTSKMTEVLRKAQINLPCIPDDAKEVRELTEKMETQQEYAEVAAQHLAIERSEKEHELSTAQAELSNMKVLLEKTQRELTTAQKQREKAVAGYHARLGRNNVRLMRANGLQIRTYAEGKYLASLQVIKQPTNAENVRAKPEGAHQREKEQMQDGFEARLANVKKSCEARLATVQPQYNAMGHELQRAKHQLRASRTVVRELAGKNRQVRSALSELMQLSRSQRESAIKSHRKAHQRYRHELGMAKRRENSLVLALKKAKEARRTSSSSTAVTDDTPR